MVGVLFVCRSVAEAIMLRGSGRGRSEAESPFSLARISHQAKTEENGVPNHLFGIYLL